MKGQIGSQLNNMKTKTVLIISLLYKIMCVSFFIYYCHRSLHSFVHQSPITKDVTIRQESYPRPLICVTFKKFWHDYTNLTDENYDKYKKGEDWLLGYSSEEGAFEAITPELFQLIRLLKHPKHD